MSIIPTKLFDTADLQTAVFFTCSDIARSFSYWKNGLLSQEVAPVSEG